MCVWVWVWVCECVCVFVLRKLTNTFVYNLQNLLWQFLNIIAATVK